MSKSIKKLRERILEIFNTTSDDDDPETGIDYLIEVHELLHEIMDKQAKSKEK